MQAIFSFFLTTVTGPLARWLATAFAMEGFSATQRILFVIALDIRKHLQDLVQKIRLTAQFSKVQRKKQSHRKHRKLHETLSPGT